MNRLSYIGISFGAAVLSLAVSCSTVKNVPEGSYRLTANVVNIIGDGEQEVPAQSELSNYIRQRPDSYFIGGKTGGWNPSLCIYNWDNGKGGGWDDFVHKVGTPPVILDTDLIARSEENISTHLRFLGYYDSQVTDTIVLKGDRKAYVRYDVRPGRRYPISGVEYEISDSELEKEYFADSSSFLIRPGEYLSEQLLEQESVRAADALKNRGYYDFSKNFFFFEADTTAADSALLKVMVRNYTRHEKPKDAKPHLKYHFSGVDIYPISDPVKYRASLNTGIPLSYDTLSFGGINLLYSGKRTTRESVLLDLNRIVPGSQYSDEVVDNTYQRYSNLRSFSTVSVQLDKSAADSVACSIYLLPAKTNAYKLNLEASVNSTGLLGIAPAISYTNRNIFRGGEWLNLSVKGNFQFRFKDPVSATEFSASSGLSFPTFVFLPDHLFKIVPRTDVNVTYNFQQRPDYTRNRFGADFGYSWSTENERWSFKLHPVQANVIKMRDVSDSLYIKFMADRLLYEQYKSNIELGAGFSFSYMSVPSLNPQVSNLKATFSFDMAGNLLSAFNGCMPTDTSGAHTVFGTPYSQFIRTEASVTYTWKFGRDNRQAIAVRGTGGLGLAYGNSEVVPYERQFWVGGANSMRGWNARELGPGAYPRHVFSTIPSQTGNVRIEANAEYRFPLLWKLNGAVFFDWGNVWSSKVDDESWSYIDTSGETFRYIEELANLTLDTLFKRSALNTGFGVRCDLSFVVIRLDLGIKLYDPLLLGEWRPVNTWFNSDGYALHFSIGYPF